MSIVTLNQQEINATNGGFTLKELNQWIPEEWGRWAGVIAGSLGAVLVGKSLTSQGSAKDGQSIGAIAATCGVMLATTVTVLFVWAGGIVGSVAQALTESKAK